MRTKPHWRLYHWSACNIVHSIYNFKIQVTFIFNDEIYEQNNIKLWIANSKLYMY